MYILIQAIHLLVVGPQVAQNFEVDVPKLPL